MRNEDGWNVGFVLFVLFARSFGDCKHRQRALLGDNQQDKAFYPNPDDDASEVDHWNK
jgi:hypothetical protein